MFCVIPSSAFFFFIPHYLWKVLEGGKIKAIILELHNPILNEDTKEENKKRLVTYLKESRGQHTKYALGYVLCEILNLINTIGQIFLIDKFLGNAFLKYGLRVIEYTNVDSLEYYLDGRNPMMMVFPKMTKCLFHYYGSGGGIQDADVMCVLPLNIINEKIYVFLWFWLVILAMLTACDVIYRFIIFMSWKARYFVTCFKCRFVNRHDLLSVLHYCNVGDWFLLNLLAKNIDRQHFKELILKLSKEFQDDGIEKLLETGNGGEKMKKIP